MKRVLFVLVLMALVSGCGASARKRIASAAQPTDEYFKAATACVNNMVAGKFPAEKAMDFCLTILNKSVEAAKTAAEAASKGGWDRPIMMVQYPGGYWGPAAGQFIPTSSGEGGRNGVYRMP